MKATLPAPRHVAVATVLVLTGCQSMPEYMPAYLAGDVAMAEATLDQAIAEEAKIEVAEVQAAVGRAPGVEVDDTGLGRLYLDKAMLRLAHGDARTALEWMRVVRPSFDEAYVDTFGEYVGNLPSIVLGDGADTFRGADYEHVMIRVMLALSDLMSQRSDFRAYAFQIGEKQREILGSDFGTEQGYNPRQAYQKVAVGAYLEGVVREGELNASDARLAYERAAEYLPGSAPIADALARTTDGAFAPEGHGAVHVFYLGGRGPTLQETDIDPQSELVLLLVKAAVVLLQEHLSDGYDFSPFFQDLVPMPEVVVHDADVPPLAIRGPGVDAHTETLLDVNAVAIDQVEANRPMLLTRAILRRALKAVLISEIDDGQNTLFKTALSFVATAIETADTRCWGTLPAQLQVARVTLPEGTHTLALGDGLEATVNVRAQNDTFVLVHRPHLDQPGTAIVDATSAEYYAVEP